MSAINTSPIMNDFQPPFPDNHADETRAALQNLVSLLHPPNTTLQNPQVIKPQGVQSDPHNNGRGQPGGGFHGQELGFHQPIDIQKIVAEAESDRERYKALQEAGWSASQQSSHGYYDSSQINDMVTSLPVRLNSIANEDPPKPLEPRLLPWPGPNGNENGLLGTVRSKSESPEVRSEALRSSQQPQDQVQVQHAESVVEKLSDADIDGLFPMNKHGEPDLNDEALERLIAESGLCMDELLSGAMEPEGPTGTVSEASRPSVTQSEHSDIGGLVSDGTEESMSLEQINALIGDLTESMDLDESVNTCSPHSANLISHDQAVDLTPDTIAVLTNNWRNRQYSATPSSDTISCGTKRSSPDDSSSFSKRICKPPPFQNPIALTQQLQAILQSSSSSDHGQSSASRHQLGSSYAASFGNSDNMNKRLMKPPPYRPVSKPPTIGITNGLGSAAAASRAKSNEHEKKIKSMGFPPLMAGMKPK
ncbi:hypothetical protein L873DRAFT_1689037 [Choiromyces venosus 120613-1]|uniref:Uncharacterized protein n=1 Tax=Choiromyces venosus 120613-1 TaxID=1336337 RepID=A0A3N4JML4_9PEZI|nr:hypothetical protein L873DRAFT_1689037 [Choiromyces venosus 120613-1]